MIASLPPRKSAFEQSGKLLTVDQVNHLARATQQYELYVSVRADLTIELGRTPTDEELTERLELPGGAREYRRRVRASLRAKNLLVQSNLKLVYSVARRFTWTTRHPSACSASPSLSRTSSFLCESVSDGP